MVRRKEHGLGDLGRIEAGHDALIQGRDAERRAAGEASSAEVLERQRREREGLREAAARRKTRAAWYAHFCALAENHAALAEDYRRRAEALCEEAAGGGAVLDG